MITPEMVGIALADSHAAIMALADDAPELSTDQNVDDYKRRVVAASLTRQLKESKDARVSYKVMGTDEHSWFGFYNTMEEARARAMARDAELSLGDGAVRVSHVVKETSVFLTDTERFEVPLYVG